MRITRESASRWIDVMLRGEVIGFVYPRTSGGGQPRWGAVIERKGRTGEPIGHANTADIAADMVVDEYRREEHMETALIVDMDNTISLNVTKRPWYGPGFEERVFEDSVNEMVNRAASALFEDGTVQHLLFVSGRMEVGRSETERWLRDKAGWGMGPSVHLLMRKDEDTRPDHVIKREIYDQHIRDHYDVLLALDDKPSILELWRSLDIPAWQVREYE